jgi:hypothetical protein
MEKCEWCGETFEEGEVHPVCLSLWPYDEEADGLKAAHGDPKIGMMCGGCSYALREQLRTRCRENRLSVLCGALGM